AWWRDVLRHGRTSEFADYFDIDWSPPKTELRGKVLLPILGGQYGRVLEDGGLVVEQRDGECVLTYEGRHLPLDVPAGTCATDVNGTPGSPASFDRLHAILEQQSFRLASWRTSSDEVNYRRFFNIDHLVGVRMEQQKVFDAAHRMLGDLIRRGVVTGLRIDHPDGLALPGAYFERLQHLATGPGEAPADHGLFVVIEKVLAGDDELPAEWAVDGTTGYEFLNAVNGLFVSRAQLGAMERVYGRFTGGREPFAEVTYAAKKHVMATTFVSELERLALMLNRISESDRRSRDFTLNSLRRALVEVVACLTVYRTYVTEDGCREADRRRMTAAAAEADRRNPGIDSSLFVFVRDAVCFASAADPERLRFALRLQQFSGAVFAKAVEDMAFYRDNTLVSLNEVGGNPARPGTDLGEFHRMNEIRQRDTPLGLSATTTHDTKLGEDVRARLNVLTERVRDWQKQLGIWARLNASLRTRTANGWAPDRHDEYRFYQALVGLWPVDVPAGDAVQAAGRLAERITAFMIKSAREANRHTSWVRQSGEYEEALSRFVAQALGGRKSDQFLRSVDQLARPVAWAGAVNSLSQVLIKIASPGVPDFYQGTEFWDLHLVDPDNRQIVDFDSRARALAALHAATPDSAPALLATWPDGRLKLHVTSRLLRARRDNPTLFIDGTYAPLRVDRNGSAADVVVFLRRHANSAAVIVAPRLAAGVVARGEWPVGDVWADAVLHLPEDLPSTRWRDVLTGATFDSTAVFRLGDILSRFPVALLIATQPDSHS
ncbi:MAG: malto-oligosyltrehalose synthase, partial [Actinomycetota bacterium]|nr:malto-oligosyltrehalose synthase [Actinomycetota bacterium]